MPTREERIREKAYFIWQSYGVENPGFNWQIAEAEIDREDRKENLRKHNSPYYFSREDV